LSVAALFSVAMSVSAQSSLAAQALHDVGTNCANLALNTTCIGHASVQRTTSSGLISTTYVNSGDRASITTTHRISTSPPNAATGDFGVNVMKVQAGLPASADGLIYVVFGGGTITNVGGAGQAVWQNIDVSQTGDADQFFLIQAPKNTSGTNVTVNGATMHVGSTVCIRKVTADQIMIIVFDGSVTIGPPGLAVTIPAGFKATASVNPSGRIIPSTISPASVAAAGDLGGCANAPGLPGNILHYPIGRIVVNCPSGVGTATCTVTVNNP